MVITAAICRSVGADTEIPKSPMGKGPLVKDKWLERDNATEKAKPRDPLEPPKLNLWQSNTPEKPPKCQAAFLSCRSFCRDPCKHFPHAVVWEAQLQEGSSEPLHSPKVWQGQGSRGC